jgi:LacI family transcriptional regulator
LGLPYFLDVARPETLPQWERVQQQLIDWIKTLPKPIGLMACSDHHAQRVLDACHRADFVVPDELAVIGVDNNEEICRLSNPPLTSVIDDAHKVGYEGARLLHQLMERKVSVKKLTPILIGPQGIATRRSTDVTAIEDRLIAEVIHYIREHACSGLNMKQLPAKFGLSRTVFYRRFQEALQRSPHEEILRVQLERAKALLSQTKLPLDQVAEMAGFQSSAYLSVVFKRKTGQTAGEYRIAVAARL